MARHSSGVMPSAGVDREDPHLIEFAGIDRRQHRIVAVGAVLAVTRDDVRVVRHLVLQEREAADVPIVLGVRNRRLQ